MPWCKFFIPKMAAPGLRPDDPDLNDHIMYGKCIKGHVLKDADDWICAKTYQRLMQNAGKKAEILFFH